MGIESFQDSLPNWLNNLSSQQRKRVSFYLQSIKLNPARLTLIDDGPDEIILAFDDETASRLYPESERANLLVGEEGLHIITYDSFGMVIDVINVQTPNEN